MFSPALVAGGTHMIGAARVLVLWHSTVQSNFEKPNITYGFVWTLEIGIG